MVWVLDLDRDERPDDTVSPSMDLGGAVVFNGYDQWTVGPAIVCVKVVVAIFALVAGVGLMDSVKRMMKGWCC